MKDTPSQSDSLKFWQNVMANFCSDEFAVWQASASSKGSIDNILCVELKQSYCKILAAVSAVLAKISWNFHLSLCGCSALAGNRQYITLLSIYYRDMPCFDGLYLKKLRSACSVLRQNIDFLFGPNRALHCARRIASDGPLCAHIALLLASFDVTLPSEREKPSWINWKIEIPSSSC